MNYLDEIETAVEGMMSTELQSDLDIFRKHTEYAKVLALSSIAKSLAAIATAMMTVSDSNEIQKGK